MFGRMPNKGVVKLDDIMDKILAEMNEYGPNSPEYPALLKHMKKVIAMHPEMEKKSIDPNVIIGIIGNLLVAFTIIAYEQKHVMVSKSYDFIKKPR